MKILLKINNENVESKDVERKIRDAFLRHSVDVSNKISVEVNDNKVRLAGKVSSRACGTPGSLSKDLGQVIR